ncbi:hypothetical protein APHMUC_0637 [Anaplasma phagocytophilum str. ApMUC09]|uniref:Uncharacterized protein n=1 Tax=Anaplasma phagocytophilum str. ApMUC09 TaxID=1359152 RepID=A0A0F3N7D7_ANAPH|nr:hypothetical protein APHMUC_0636 [Anaplasma phagocytophilum str. ApMUC09]KJV65038.1 hypothetical protein APHMUC_0632 [Anaplasma phagocytophilum str. ApMUC09]KJV65073.1 hypothetical protein APHMUC_0637 [Anaplasma phagocytophilum str. ApMUC09]
MKHKASTLQSKRFLQSLVQEKHKRQSMKLTSRTGIAP